MAKTLQARVIRSVRIIPKPVLFKDIREDLENVTTRAAIGSTLNRLYVRGIIERGYTVLKSGRTVFTYSLTKEFLDGKIELNPPKRKGSRAAQTIPTIERKHLSNVLENNWRTSLNRSQRNYWLR